MVTLFARLPAVLDADALFMVYGPFNIDGEFTSKAMPRSGQPARDPADGYTRSGRSRCWRVPKDELIANHAMLTTTAAWSGGWV